MTRLGAFALAAMLCAIALAHATRAEGAEEPPGELQLVLSFVTDAGGTDTLVLGERSLATDGYDKGLDAAAPPVPPTSTWVQAYSTLAHEPAYRSRLHTDIRGEALSTTWNIALATATRTNVTLMWNASQVGAIPPFYLVTLRTDAGAIDMRTANTTILPVNDTNGLTLVIQHGAPPAPPTNVSAALAPFPLGHVVVSWTPPTSGTEPTGYDIMRADLGGPAALLAHVEGATSYTDDNAPIGHVLEYTIASTNVYGTSDPSPATLNATTIGTAPPAPLQRDDNEPRSKVLDEQADATPQVIVVPQTTEDAVTVHRADADHSTVAFDGHHTTILDGGLLPDFEPTIDPQAVTTPGAFARAELDDAPCARGAPAAGLVIVSAGAGPAAFEQPLRAPLAPCG